MNNIKDVVNPVAPAYGTTIPTLGGNLAITQNEQGYLQIGNYQTQIPMSEFRNYMHQHPEAMQQFASALVKSGFNNENVYDKFGRSYEKMDNGQIESLLSNLNYYQRTSTKDSQVGLGTIADMLEKQLEMTEDMIKQNSEEKEIK
jgi:hypothetical protein